LELEPRSVAVAQRAFDRVRLGYGVGETGEHSREPGTIRVAEQTIEPGTFDLVDAIAEQPFDRRALIRDGAVGREHGDQVAGVRQERGEPSLALGAVEIRRQYRSLDRQRDLRGESFERVEGLASHTRWCAGHEHAANLIADREREEQRRAGVVET